ncbi:MAG: hypothetical protein SFY66_25775 [Oculatellaceae cyanobacterium bins.114]|nr:hypothetical protein [Oculatellaceae cyanobacterium bins.114]
MLQAIISRMASNSLSIKQLAITIWTTLISFGFTNKAKFLFLLAILSLILLIFLDGYYLYLEKRFRSSFNQLSNILCNFSERALEEFESVEGNFISLNRISRKQILQLYTKSLASLANIPYLAALIITLSILLAT